MIRHSRKILCQRRVINAVLKEEKCFETPRAGIESKGEPIGDD